MWYDSVLQTDGSLRWQSCLNEKNYEFMLACDSFFSDFYASKSYQRGVAKEHSLASIECLSDHIVLTCIAF